MRQQLKKDRQLNSCKQEITVLYIVSFSLVPRICALKTPFSFPFFFKFCFCLNALSFFAESMCFCSYLFKIDGCWFCQMLQWICCACVFCICLHVEFGMIISKLKYILRCGLLWQIQTHLKNSYKSKVRNSIDL